ncbi:hypothetical protein P154DRAFT_519449 [Amniculicola lignicola CBS 123094]|uniref:F-box domain-containing protein n=1 Tax=Amniculicola lignicola CBS 123094 TaxID=1392246 RepID=A0A6A5WTF9_9PLEO|nr:hypothetical protein P154DRAFT_519449 [Amniculicola lignicola CBS 123094]
MTIVMVLSSFSLLVVPSYKHLPRMDNFTHVTRNTRSKRAGLGRQPPPHNTAPTRFPNTQHSSSFKIGIIMCPPQQPQDRFPQDFSLVAPELAEVLVDPATSPAKLLSFFATESSPWLWATFTKPVDGVRPTQTYHRRPPIKPSFIEKLPNELLDLLVDALDEKRDIVALGLASSVLWPVVLHRIHQEYRRCAAPWAGKQIAFHGNYSWSTSQNLVGEGVPRDVIRELNYYRYYWPHRFQCDIFTDVRPMDQGWIDTLKDIKRQAGFSAADWIEIERDLSCHYMFPQDRVWVLRNLTTSQYVRSDQLHPNPQAVKEAKEPIISIYERLRRFVRTSQQRRTDDCPFTLAQVLLCMTRWSTRRFFPPEAGPHGLNGSWVGHRFDIVTLDRHNSEEDPAGWTDASEEAVKFVLDVRNGVLDESHMKKPAKGRYTQTTVL